MAFSAGAPPVPLQPTHLDQQFLGPQLSRTPDARMPVSPDGRRRSKTTDSTAHHRASITQLQVAPGAAGKGGAAEAQATAEAKIQALTHKVASAKKQNAKLESELRQSAARCRRLECRVTELETHTGVRAVREQQAQQQHEEEVARLVDERDHLDKRVRRLGEQASKYPQIERALCELFTEFVGGGEAVAAPAESDGAGSTKAPNPLDLLRGIGPMSLVDYLRCGLRAALQAAEDTAAELRRQLAKAEKRSEQVALELVAAEQALEREREEARQEKFDGQAQELQSELAAQLDSAQQECVAARAQSQELRRDIAKRDRELAALRDEVEQRERALMESEKRAREVPRLEEQLAKAQRRRQHEENGEEIRLRNQISGLDQRFRAMQERALRAEADATRCKELEIRVKDLERAPVQQQLVDLAAQRDRLSRRLSELEQEGRKLRREASEMSTKASAWRNKHDALIDRYQELFSAVHRRQKRERHSIAAAQRHGRQDTQQAGTNADIAFWKARVDDAQREAQALCTQLKRCILQEHRDQTRFAAERAQLLSTQRALETSLSRLRERYGVPLGRTGLEGDELEETASWAPCTSPSFGAVGLPRSPVGTADEPAVRSVPSPVRQRQEDSTPQMTLIVSGDGSVEYGNSVILTRSTIVAGEGCQEGDVAFEEGSVRTLRRPERDFAQHPSLVPQQKRIVGQVDPDFTRTPPPPPDSPPPVQKGKRAIPLVARSHPVARLAATRCASPTLLSPRSFARVRRRARRGSTGRLKPSGAAHAATAAARQRHTESPARDPRDLAAVIIPLREAGSAVPAQAGPAASFAGAAPLPESAAQAAMSSPAAGLPPRPGSAPPARQGLPLDPE